MQKTWNYGEKWELVDRDCIGYQAHYACETKREMFNAVFVKNCSSLHQKHVFKTFEYRAIHVTLLQTDLKMLQTHTLLLFKIMDEHFVFPPGCRCYCLYLTHVCFMVTFAQSKVPNVLNLGAIKTKASLKQIMAPKRRNHLLVK